MPSHSSSVFRSAIATGVRTLATNPLRSALSTLGIIIGVASLVAVLALGDGMEALARREIASTTDVQMLSITAVLTRKVDGIDVPRGDLVTFTAGDAASLARQVDTLGAVTLVQQGAAVARRDTTAAAAMVFGTLPATAIIQGHRVATGRYLDDADVRERRPVAVVNARLAALLASPDGGSLVGTRISLNDSAVTIVGVLDGRTDSTAQPLAIVPLTAASGVLSAAASARPPALLIKAATIESFGEVRTRTEAWLGERFADWPSRLTIGTSESRLAQVRQGMLLFKLFMGAITGISLVVGGIGIMNVLLAAVAERTREIGIRRAVGARGRDVLLQFLAESVAITGAGSAVGAALGLGAAFGITAIIRAQAENIRLEAAFTWGTLALAVIAAVSIGLAFGLYPALRAARLPPIDAIRHE